MSRRFAELDAVDTSMGTISLRRRLEPSRKVDVYEVKLGDEFLMSSLFTVAEIELARLGLAALDTPGDATLDVVVGGLGLGYTALAALEDPRVGQLTVVEALPEVIAWHERELLPDTVGLAADPRVELRAGDFFALTAGDGYDPATPGRRHDAILVDIDHTPTHHLADAHAGFYTVDGLRHLRRHLVAGGVFALWSDRAFEASFLDTVREAFDEVVAHEVRFANFLTGGTSANSVLVAR